MAMKELIRLAEKMAKPFLQYPHPMTPQHCMPFIKRVLEDYSGFIHELKTEILRLDPGEALHDAQFALEAVLGCDTTKWLNDDRIVKDPKTTFNYWWTHDHVGVAHVLQKTLFLQVPAMALAHSESFIHCRTRFLERVTPLLAEFGLKAPQGILGSQLFLPQQLAKIPAIAAHFIKQIRPDCLGRTITHLLYDAGSRPQPSDLNLHGTPDILRRTPLYFACRGGDEKRADQLLCRNLGLNVYTSNGLLPIHVAAIAGATSICDRICYWTEKMTSAPLDANIPDFFGRSSHLWAVCFGHEATAAFLLPRMRTQLSDQGSCGLTAVHIAASEGHLTILTNLIKHGYSFHEPDCFGRTPFWYASKSNSSEIMKILDGLGADVNQSDSDGMTSLHIAAQNGSVDALRYLLSLNPYNPLILRYDYFRVHVRALNHHNHSPLVVAAIARHAQCVKELVQCGRKALDDPDDLICSNVRLAAAIVRHDHDQTIYNFLQPLLVGFELVGEPALPTVFNSAICGNITLRMQSQEQCVYGVA
jgi:ankyrin repeat protein